MSKKNKVNKFWLALVLVVVLSLGITGAALAASPDAQAPVASAAKPVSIQVVSSSTKDVVAATEQETTDASEAEDVNDVEEPEDAEEPEDSSNEADEDAALAGTAKISESDAIAAAEKAYPGYTFVSNGLENENGTTVYGLVGTKSGKSIEVKIDAATGSILPEQDGEFEG